MLLLGASLVIQNRKQPGGYTSSEKKLGIITDHERTEVIQVLRFFIKK